ncbi:MAG: hypothetical protein FGF50_11825 [Candidatus Brockarchaeota archaeon]|nr:hypothetical protein [Candidatus Brockarchaeota archaeon]
MLKTKYAIGIMFLVLLIVFGTAISASAEPSEPNYDPSLSSSSMWR